MDNRIRERKEATIMTKVKIGLSSCITWLPNGTERAYLNQDYIKSVEKAGGVPLILPITDNVDIIKALAESIDGLLLTGGEDINPLLFGEEPDPMLGEICEARDRFELLLFGEVYRLKKPIFGICRGLQLMTIALGGTLWQEVSRKPGDLIKHSQETDRKISTHHVNILPSSQLEPILGLKARVNSYHHQAAKSVGTTGKITATASDGIIEAIDWSTPHHYCQAVQWHPEAMIDTHPEMLNLFKDFIQHCQK